MKLAKEEHGGAFVTYRFYCPGCKHDHVYNERWTFNGNMEKPSFTPSLLVWHDGDPKNGIAPFRCHLYVTDGRIQFLGDSTHELRGKTVDMEEIKKMTLRNWKREQQ